MGIAPSGQQITLRSLDFWRCEQGLIRENWVLVDLLDAHRQIATRCQESFTIATGSSVQGFFHLRPEAFLALLRRLRLHLLQLLDQPLLVRRAVVNK